MRHPGRVRVVDEARACGLLRDGVRTEALVDADTEAAALPRDGDFGGALHAMRRALRRYVNVSVERIDYAPVRLR